MVQYIGRTSWIMLVLLVAAEKKKPDMIVSAMCTSTACDCSRALYSINEMRSISFGKV